MPDQSVIGDIVMSMLEEDLFRKLQLDSAPSNDFAKKKWTLANGGKVPGSKYATLRKDAQVPDLLPDLRGRYPRGRDQGSEQVPEGNVATGTILADTFMAHTHAIPNADQGCDGGGDFFACKLKEQNGNDNTSRGPTGPANVGGGSETRPKSVIVNFFIKIND